MRILDLHFKLEMKIGKLEFQLQNMVKTNRVQYKH